MTRRHMTELEQLAMINSELTSALDYQKQRARWLKTNLAKALTYLVLCLSILALVIIGHMAPHLLIPVTQAIAFLLHPTTIHWFLLGLLGIVLAGIWAWVIWTEITYDGGNT